MTFAKKIQTASTPTTAAIKRFVETLSTTDAPDAQAIIKDFQAYTARELAPTHFNKISGKRSKAEAWRLPETKANLNILLEDAADKLSMEYASANWDGIKKALAASKQVAKKAIPSERS